jgi:hypothetical protein
VKSCTLASPAVYALFTRLSPETEKIHLGIFYTVVSNLLVSKMIEKKGLDPIWLSWPYLLLCCGRGASTLAFGLCGVDCEIWVFSFLYCSLKSPICLRRYREKKGLIPLA